MKLVNFLTFFSVFEHILQKRENVAFITKLNLNYFSKWLASWTRQVENREVNRTDWPWKINDGSKNSFSIEKTIPMGYLKKNYWGNQMAKFHLKLVVS